MYFPSRVGWGVPLWVHFTYHFTKHQCLFIEKPPTENLNALCSKISLEDITWGYRSRNCPPSFPWEMLTEGLYSLPRRSRATTANLDWVFITCQLHSKLLMCIRSFNSHNSQVGTIIPILLMKNLWHRETKSLMCVPTNSYDKDNFIFPGESW